MREPWLWPPDTTATLKESYGYDPWGVPTTASGVGNPYLFTGQRYDPETKLYYYKNRHYNPSLGRFMQRDPIGFGDDVNLYSYVGNNPLRWLDPWGLERTATSGGEDILTYNNEGIPVLRPREMSTFDQISLGLSGSIGSIGRGMAKNAAINLGNKFFARGTGILNNNSYFRIGWGWKGSATSGKEVFRIAVGNPKAPIHWHFDWPF